MAATKRRLTTLKSKLPTLAPRIPTIGQPGSWRTTGMTTAERGYGYAWQQARARHLSANPLCVYCLRDNRVEPANVVDHKVPHRGDKVLFWCRRAITKGSAKPTTTARSDARSRRRQLRGEEGG